MSQREVEPNPRGFKNKACNQCGAVFAPESGSAKSCPDCKPRKGPAKVPVDKTTYCELCNLPFVATPKEHWICSDCIDSPAAKQIWKPRARVKCAENCLHAVRNADSYCGFSCRIEKHSDCCPIGPAKHFTPRNSS